MLIATRSIDSVVWEIIGLILIVALVGYLVTSLDIAVNMLSAINTCERGPNARNRAVWGVLLVGVGIMTTYLDGGTSTLESFSTTLALSFTGLFVLVLPSTWVYARQEYPKEFQMTLEELLRQTEFIEDDIQAYESDGGDIHEAGTGHTE